MAVFFITYISLGPKVTLFEPARHVIELLITEFAAEPVFDIFRKQKYFWKHEC